MEIIKKLMFPDRFENLFYIFVETLSISLT